MLCKRAGLGYTGNNDTKRGRTANGGIWSLDGTVIDVQIDDPKEALADWWSRAETIHEHRFSANDEAAGINAGQPPGRRGPVAVAPELFDLIALGKVQFEGRTASHVPSVRWLNSGTLALPMPINLVMNRSGPPGLTDPPD